MTPAATTPRKPLYSVDEVTALAEQVARAYALLHGMRYSNACTAITAKEDGFLASGDMLAAMTWRLEYCDPALLPPEAVDPALHRAVYKVRLEVEALRFAAKGWAALTREETKRADEVLRLMDEARTK